MAIPKMAIMLPVMLAARRLDGEDPNVVFYLRCSYFSVQSMIVLAVLYIFWKVYNICSDPKKKKDLDHTIYVAPPASPFADPNADPSTAKKTYQELKFSSHLMTQTRSLLGSTLFGIAMTCGLHFYRGMVVGLAIQSIMGPFNLFENKLVKALLFFSDNDNQSLKDKRIFDEKHRHELEQNAEITDKEGNTLKLKQINATANTTNSTVDKNKPKNKPTDLETILLDTWDQATPENVNLLLSKLNKSNVNFQTKESKWTPLMILSTFTSKTLNDALNTLKDLKPDPTIIDGEGWNALHWACFHGGDDGCKFLLKHYADRSLHTVKDKEGLTPLEHARKENNLHIVDIVESAIKKNT